MNPNQVDVTFEDGSNGTTTVLPLRALIAGLSPIRAEHVREIAALVQNIGADIATIGDNIETIGDNTETIGDNTKTISRGVGDIAAWPLLTSDLDGGSPASGGRGEPGRFRPIVLNEVRRVLGGLPKQDGAAVAAALTASFELTEYEGTVRAKWVPRSYTGLINTGPGVTGAQASLAAFARTALDETLPLIDSLKSLAIDTDPEELEAVRAILRTSWTEFVDELGVEGGPRAARANHHARQLDRDPAAADRVSYVRLFGRHLGLLRDDGTLDRDRIVLTADETTLTDYIVVRDYVRNVVRAWVEYTAEFGAGAIRDLGSGLVRVERALTVVDESVDELYSALESVFVGPDERLTLSFDTLEGPMVIEELLTWVQVFARTEAPRLVEEAGTFGVEVIENTIVTGLQPAVAQFLAHLQTRNGGGPEALGHPRVLNAASELSGALENARDAAHSVVGAGGRVFS